MPDYNGFVVSDGMVGVRNGWMYAVVSVSDGVARCKCVEDGTFADMPVEAVRQLAESGELRVEWPPSLRPENMPS